MSFWSRLFCTFAVVFSMFSATPAHAYEAELKQMANSLAYQMQAAGHYRGTVLDFTDLQGKRTELGRQLANELADYLLTTGKGFSLLSRSKIIKMLEANELPVNSLTDLDSVRDLGELLGVDTIFVGTATSVGGPVKLNVRAMDVVSGSIVGREAATLPMNSSSTVLDRLPAQEMADSSSTSTDTLGDGITYQGARLRYALRSDSIIMTAKSFLVSEYYWIAKGAPDRSSFYDANANFSVKNASDMPLSIAILSTGIAAGPCTFPSDFDFHEPGRTGVRGLPVFTPTEIASLNPRTAIDQFQWLPAGATAAGSITIDGDACNAKMVSDLTEVDVSLSVVLADQTDIVTIPLVTRGVAIHKQ